MYEINYYQSSEMNIILCTKSIIISHQKWI